MDRWEGEREEAMDRVPYLAFESAVVKVGEFLRVALIPAVFGVVMARSRDQVKGDTSLILRPEQRRVELHGAHRASRSMIKRWKSE